MYMYIHINGCFLLFKGKLIFLEKEEEMSTGYGHTVLMSQLHILPGTTHFNGIMLNFVCLLWSASGKKEHNMVMMLLKLWITCSNLVLFHIVQYFSNIPINYCDWTARCKYILQLNQFGFLFYLYNNCKIKSYLFFVVVAILVALWVVSPSLACVVGVPLAIWTTFP